MAVISKPIPALYTVYILRSTVRHASLYVGSTPNPPRRLSQHNGKARGGAARTSRASLRPWEMVALVSGFPSSVAALKFEWALENSHLSLHIPTGSRLTVSTTRKKSGLPRKPTKSIVSIVSNLHLLLRVPSFSHWPLTLHFFAEDVYKEWQKWSSAANEPTRKDLPVVTDFTNSKVISGRNNSRQSTKNDAQPASSEMLAPQIADAGIHRLPLDYEPIKEYVKKGKEVFDFEREGQCVVCRQALNPGGGLYALCTNEGCEGVGHLSCWSQHLLRSGGTDSVLPIEGHCPSCNGSVHWGAMMKELTLRLRGGKEVEKLLKKRRSKADGG